MTFAVIATGPSLTQAQVDAVRHLRVIAVSDAYKMAPWAEALVSADNAWWDFHRPEFAGRRFSARKHIDREYLPGVPTGLNSGVLGIKVAAHLGAQRIILLGFDGHGTHFFGSHPKPLKNTTDSRRMTHARQHKRESLACARLGISILNCSPGTVLAYPKSTLADALNRNF